MMMIMRYFSYWLATCSQKNHQSDLAAPADKKNNNNNEGASRKLTYLTRLLFLMNATSSMDVTKRSLCSPVSRSIVMTIESINEERDDTLISALFDTRAVHIDQHSSSG